MSEIEELRATVASYRALLKETRRNLAQAEAKLAKALAKAKERASNPQVGDFARSTLTNFYGCVTKVIPRANGKPWVEITPYLTEDLPGKTTMDLFDQWELIEKPVSGRNAAKELSALEIATSLAAALRAPVGPQSEPDTSVVVERGERHTNKSAVAHEQGNVLTAKFGRQSNRKNSA